MTKILVSDAMEQIQAKLKHGGDIQFEKGTYKITKQLHLYSKITLDLNGAKLLRNGDIQSVFITHIDKNTTEYNGQHDIIIKNATIENIGKFYADNLIHLVHSQRITIDNVTFVDGSMHDIECNSSCDVMIRNCTFKGHYTKDSKHSYVENIQIDMATFSGFVLKGTKPTDKIYDGTCCKNITIEGCVFVKGYRGGINCCIGQHCQQSDGKYHENITIKNNKMSGYGANTESVAIRLIGFKNVIVENNQIEGFGCAVFVKNNSYSYDKHGNKITAGSNDGICTNITIKNNVINSPSGSFVIFDVFIVSKTKGNHQNVIKENNVIHK